MTCEIDRETRRLYAEERRRFQEIQESGGIEDIILNTDVLFMQKLQKVAAAAIGYHAAINDHQNENALIDYWTGMREVYLFSAAIAAEVSLLDDDKKEFLSVASECTRRIKKHEKHRDKNCPVDLD